MNTNIQEPIFEMSLSELNEKKISRKLLRVEKPTVFITIPDTNLKIWESIYQSGLFIYSAKQIVIPNKIIKIINKTFNGKEYALDAKKKFQATAEHGKKIKITHTFNDLKNIDINRSKSFYFYDLSIFSKALKHFSKKQEIKITSRQMLSLLSNEYSKLKNQHPNINFEMLWFMKDTNGVLFDIVSNFRSYMPKNLLSELPLYDNFLLVSNSNNVIIPILYKNKGKNDFATQNINKLKNYLQIEDTKKEIQNINPVNKQEKEVDEFPELDDKDTSIEKIADELSKTKLKKTNNEEIKVELDNKKLSSILRKYKIKDPDIVANVKASLDEYINLKGKKLTQEEAEEIVFKSIHNSIYGTDEIDSEFLKDPEKLIRKLEKARIHQTPLIFDNYTKNTNLINPTDIIDINHTTGVWRQKEEFEKTIHGNIKKLFKSLEQVSDNPVQVKNIEHEIIDDDLNRFIKYKVTLQNTGGGKKEPYNVYLNVPTVINDRYLKLNGVTYITPVQQMMKPVTKTNKDEVRILTNYAPVRLKLNNMKFTPNEIKEIINYIQIKYPSLIKEYNTKDEYIKFNDNTIIYLTNTTVYESINTKIEYNEDTQTLINQKGQEIKEGKTEYIYNVFIEKIQGFNSDDQLTKTNKSIPFFSLYVGGIQLPFIIYLWQEKGLLTALNEFGVNYEITDKSNTARYTIRHNGKYLAIYPENKREEFFCNGLFVFKINKNIEDLDDPTQIHNLIDRTYGQKAVFNMKEANENMIDPITKELLEFEGLPVSLSNLLTSTCIDKLMNDDIDSLADLKIYRGRLSEMFLNLMYSQIKSSHSEYRRKLTFDDEDAKINLYENWLIENAYAGGGILDFYSEPTNPIEEINSASKTIKTGPSGVPGKISFKKQHRNLHPSHIGNMGANASSEGNTGLDVAHTLTCAIMNEFGSYGKKNINGLSGWNTLSMTECLTPFMNEIDSDRMVMATIHSRQVTPTNGNEPPLIGTGGEYIATQLSSRRFIQKSKKDGVVEKVVPNKYITIKYNDGSTESFDIYPRLSKTKMNNFITLEMTTPQEGEKVNKEQPVAWTKNFNKNGMYCSGRNTRVAVMQYNGLSHEDAYCVSEEFSENMTRDILREISVIIPPETKVLNLEKEIGKQVSSDDLLVEFSYDDDLDSYLDAYDLHATEDDTDLNMYQSNNETIKLMGKNGIISDIKVFINNKNLIDKNVSKFHKELVNDTKKTIDILSESYTNESDKIKASDNIPLKFTKFGGHKLKGGVEFTGARIVYHIKQKIPLMVGDKLAPRSGAKGVISNVLNKDKTPYAKSGNIEVFISPTTVFSRKNLTIIKELYLGKIIKSLDTKLKEMANDSKIKTNEISKLLYTVYNALGDDKTKTAVNNFMTNIPENKFRKLLKTNELNLFFPIPPFSKVEFDQIINVAKILDIELDEYVYLPEFERYTKKKVPVGYMYYQALEQTSDSYSSVRSTAGYHQMTGQPVKGKSRGGGQSIGQLDINALLTLNNPAVLEELITLRADQHQTKRSVINTIINNGSSNLPKAIRTGETHNMLDVFMNSMGLFTR